MQLALPKVNFLHNFFSLALQTASSICMVLLLLSNFRLCYLALVMKPALPNIILSLRIHFGLTAITPFYLAVLVSFSVEPSQLPANHVFCQYYVSNVADA